MDTTSASVPVSGSPRSPRPARGRMIRVRVSDEEYAVLAEKGAAVGGMSKLLRDQGKTETRADAPRYPVDESFWENVCIVLMNAVLRSQ